MALFVENIIAPANPCRSLIASSIHMLTEKAAIKLPMPNTAMAKMNILLLPVRSAILPSGTFSDETASIYAVTTHPTTDAPTPKCASIFGIARFSELPMKVVINAVVMQAISVCFCSAFISELSSSFHCLEQGHLIGILEVASDRDAVSYPAHFYA